MVMTHFRGRVISWLPLQPRILAMFHPTQRAQNALIQVCLFSALSALFNDIICVLTEL